MISRFELCLELWVSFTYSSPPESATNAFPKEPPSRGAKQSIHFSRANYYVCHIDCQGGTSALLSYFRLYAFEATI